MKLQTGKLLILACAMFLLGGCALMNKTAVRPPMGILFCDIKAPITTEYPNTPRGQKIGSTVSTRFFQDIIFTGLSFAWDDASLKNAIQTFNANSTAKADYAEYEFFHVLGVYAEFRINYYGKP